MDKSAHPKIVIVGRPNVGKSSLFNRIVGSRKAIVEATCGTTRDRLYADIAWKGKAFTIVDTGGFEPARPGDMAVLILRQLQAAIDEADIIFFVTDGTAGVTPQDIDFAHKLRKTSKRIYLIVNKVDDGSKASGAMEFYELGLGECYVVSAVNGIGIDKLLDDVSRVIEKRPVIGDRERVKVAVVGRPNVGKSSFLNSVFGEERVIVHPVAGTTRDAVDTDFNYKDGGYLLIDTAGIRHNAKIAHAADFYGSVRSREAVRRADVALVLIDGFDGLREDDKRIIEFVIQEGKGLVVAVNKWDLAEGVEMSKYTGMLMKKMDLLKHYPVIFTSCKTRRNVLACLDAVRAVYGRARAIIPPEELKEILKGLNNASELKSKRMRLLYLVQEGALPPSFVVGIKGGREPGENIKRYIGNTFRRSRDYAGVPIRIRYNS